MDYQIPSHLRRTQIIRYNLYNRVRAVASQTTVIAQTETKRFLNF